MKPTPKVFSRQQPCTKIEIFNCFRGPIGWRRVQVDQVHAEIGVYTPRAMRRAERLRRWSDGQTDYYLLTPEGEAWLLRGTYRYLQRHLSRVPQLYYLPPQWDDLLPFWK